MHPFNAHSPAPSVVTSRRAKRLLGGLLSLAGALFNANASAQSADGLYGRFDGDVEIGAGAGAAIDVDGPMLALRATAVYLWSAGFYAAYNERFSEDDDNSSVTRSIATGVHFRPLFLGRWGSNTETGPAFVDLMIDSFALEVGPFWADQAGSGWSTTPGFEVAAELSAPLIGEASGPFVGVRGALRIGDDDLSGRRDVGIGRQGSFVALVLTWREIVHLHIVDAGDRLSR